MRDDAGLIQTFRSGLAIGALLLASVGSATAQVNCSSTPLTFCDGCRLTNEWKTKPGRLCTVPTRFAGGVISIRVTRKARQGIAVVSSNSYGYRASPTLKGSDSFAIEIRYRSRAGTAETTQINVNVTPLP